MGDKMRVLLQGSPATIAHIKGSEKYKNITGVLSIYPWSQGSIVKIEVMGLPGKKGENNFFGFHIRETDECIEDSGETFESEGEHFSNSGTLSHPSHTGDLPLLYSNDGYSYMIFYTSKFKPEEVKKKSVIIHKMIDDFSTQPSGNSGERIACGEIE